jgi:guanylate kinase
MVSRADLDRLRAGGQVVWENARYGAVYAIDRGYVESMFASGLVPVFHAGQPEVIGALAKAFPGAELTSVSLTCPRDVAAARIAERATGDTAERLAAYDGTPALTAATLTIDTNVTPAGEAARQIAVACLGKERDT